MTLADWWALLDADPGVFPWPVLADWLDDRGDARADAARELGRRGWEPRYSQALYTWDWWRAGGGRPPGPDDLPAEVFFRLADFDERRSEESAWCSYPSASAACAALLDALTPVV